jgi:hypothetical protein
MAAKEPSSEASSEEEMAEKMLVSGIEKINSWNISWIHRGWITCKSHLISCK